MCGRYYVDDGTIRAIQNMIPGTDPMSQGKRCGDICPSCTAFVITGRTPQLSIETMSWGFPQYQKKGLVINARAETVLERKMFRDSILHRRCIIPARQYYEWDADRNKVTFSRKEQPVIYMAGCFDQTWRLLGRPGKARSMRYCKVGVCNIVYFNLLRNNVCLEA